MRVDVLAAVADRKREMTAARTETPTIASTEKNGWDEYCLFDLHALLFAPERPQGSYATLS